MLEQLSKVITKVRETTPLVQAITNYVTINDCANILLAIGASPAMVENPEEASDFAQISSAVYLNVGTLTSEQEAAMLRAMMGASSKNVPVILDPVGCAAIPRKLSVIERLSSIGKFSIIKGNAGEIKFLSGISASSRGVDSLEGEEGIEEACVKVSQKYGCVTAATGKTDVITDGSKVVKIYNGTEYLTRITGAGCMAGALCAGTAGAEESPLLAAASALLMMSIAGEKSETNAKGPGSFRSNLMDEIYNVTENTLLKEGKIEWK